MRSSGCVIRKASLVAVLLAFLAVSIQGQARFTTFPEIRGVLGLLADALPAELKIPNATEAEPAWNSWVRQRDTGIRGRLQRGDEETIVNWLLPPPPWPSPWKSHETERRSARRGIASKAHQLRCVHRASEIPEWSVRELRRAF